MEDAWIKAAQQGDQEAIAWLVAAYQRPVYGLCYRLLGEATEAEDAAQDALVKAMMNLHTFELGRPLRPWLFRIAANLCTDRLRRRRPTVSLDGMGEDGAWEWTAGTAISPERQLEEAESQARVRALLETLSPQDRAVVTMFYWHDMSYIEIAEATELSISAVKSRLFRARREMAQQLQQEEAYV